MLRELRRARGRRVQWLSRSRRRREHLDGLWQRLVREPATTHRTRPISPRSSSRTRTPITASTSTVCTSCTSTDSRCNGLPVYAPEGVERDLERLVGEWTDTFDWKLVGDGDRRRRSRDTQLRFSRTDHPLPTVAVEIEQGGKRLVYTADTGPSGASSTFRPGADLVLSEATYQHDDIRVADPSLGAPGRRSCPRGAVPGELMLTHLWPTLDPVASVEEGSEAFGQRGDARRTAPRHPHLAPTGDAAEYGRIALTTRASGRAARRAARRSCSCATSPRWPTVRCSSSSAARVCCAPRRSKSVSRRG